MTMHEMIKLHVVRVAACVVVTTPETSCCILVKLASSGHPGAIPTRSWIDAYVLKRFEVLTSTDSFQSSPDKLAKFFEACSKSEQNWPETAEFS
jgi:hypothetical protein